MWHLTVRLDDGYCSITVANHRLIIVIRFVAKSYTWKKKIVQTAPYVRTVRARHRHRHLEKNCLLLRHRHRTYARGAFPPAAIMARRHESGPRRAFSSAFIPFLAPICVRLASALQRKLLLILQLASLMSPGQAWFRRMRAQWIEQF